MNSVSPSWNQEYTKFLQKIANERDEKISVITQDFKEKLLNIRNLATNDEPENVIRSKIEQEYDEQIFLVHDYYADQISNFPKQQSA